MRLVITASGGGHFSPALSVIEHLPKDWTVCVFGRKHSFEGDAALSLEYLVCKKQNIPFESISSGRLQRKLTRFTFSSLLKLPLGFLQSLVTLRKYRPDCILSFGGYISLPVCFSAYLLKIPVIIHEQTLAAGLANKIAGRIAKKICVSWSSSLTFFPKSKTILTGNPVQIDSRESLGKIVPEFFSFEKIPLIVVLGGSTGSHAINLLIEKVLERILKKYRLILVTGDSKQYKDFDRLSSLKQTFSQTQQKRFYLEKFFYPSQIPVLLKECTLVISRSGVNTITQLIFYKKPSIIIPLSVSQGSEQLQNARLLKNLGLGEILVQEDSSSEMLIGCIDNMIQHIDRYSKIKKTFSLPGRPEDAIINVIRKVIDYL